jgi:hypothetical protein
MPELNSFLAEFIKMRKEINPLPHGKPGVNTMTPARKDKPSKKVVVKDSGLAHIIEHKPHKKVVLEHLQKRANDLTTEKMA